MREVAALAPWSQFIDDIASVRTKILPLDAYYDLLSPHAAEVDVWHNTNVLSALFAAFAPRPQHSPIETDHLTP